MFSLLRNSPVWCLEACGSSVCVRPGDVLLRTPRWTRLSKASVLVSIRLCEQFGFSQNLRLFFVCVFLHYEKDMRKHNIASPAGLPPPSLLLLFFSPLLLTDRYLCIYNWKSSVMATWQSESLSCVISQKITFWLVYLAVARNHWAVVSGITGWSRRCGLCKIPKGFEKALGHYVGILKASQRAEIFTESHKRTKWS